MNGKIIYREKDYNCPLELSMDIVGGKWKSIIVFYLRKGAKRSGELQKMMPSITNKIYTHSLRELERDNIISRKVYPVVPPHVEYSLTPRGEMLVPILKDMVRWGNMVIDSERDTTEQD